jgi:hypothetical protein
MSMPSAVIQRVDQQADAFTSDGDVLRHVLPMNETPRS